MAARKIDDFPEMQQLIARLKGGKPNEMISIFIPSHDKHQKPVPDQKLWADQALTLFGQLFTGATAFRFLDGVYQTKELTLLYDNPIMIQSLTETKNLESEKNLVELAEFCENMGTRTKQNSIASF